MEMFSQHTRMFRLHGYNAFVSVCPDEDDEGERNAVPLAPLDSFFSDNESLKQQKKKKVKKMKEGKMPKVKKRKKEVRCKFTFNTVCHDLERHRSSGVLGQAGPCLLCFTKPSLV